MKRIQIFLKDSKNVLELSDQFPISLNFQIAEIRDLGSAKGSYSEKIVVPGSKANNKVFSNLWNINVADFSFDINKKQKAILFVDDIRQMEGYIQLTNIIKNSKSYIDGDEELDYEILFFDETVNFFDLLRDEKLEDLDFSQHNHIYSFQNIYATSAWTADDSVYTYFHPYTSSINGYETKDFKPAIFLKSYIDKIFQSKKFSYECDLFESDDFKRLIIPFNGGEELQKIDNDEIERRKFRVSFSGNPFSYNDTINTLPTSNFFQKVRYNDEFSNNNFDPNDHYSTTLFEYTADRNGVVDLFASIPVKFIFSSTTHAEIQPTSFFGGSPSWVNKSFTPYLVIRKNNSVVPVYQKQFWTQGTVFWPNVIQAGQTIFQNKTIQKIAALNLATNIGDKFTVEVKYPNRFQYYTSGTTLAHYTNSNLNDDAKIMMEIESGGVDDSYYFNEPHQTFLIDGDLIKLNQFIPKNILQKDIFKSVVTAFNLYIKTDEDYENKLIIKTRDEFYNEQDFVDWTNKIDYSKPNNIKLLPELLNKRIKWTYKDDGDFWNKSYRDRVSETYGQKEIEFANEYVTGEEKKEIIFSPTPIINNVNFGMYSPAIEVGSPKNNIRLIYKGNNLKSDVQFGFNWIDNTGQNQTTYLDDYIYAGHFDLPINPSQDYNFGENLFLMYYGWQNLTNNNLYNRYWSNYINGILQGRMLSAYFYLTEKDIAELDFSKKIFIKDTYYILNKISNYNPTINDLTFVELLKIDEGVKFYPQSTTLTNGTSVGQILEEFYSPGLPIGKNDNTGTGGLVLGEGNQISPDSLNTIIQGDNNQVFSSSDTIIRGSNNTTTTRQSTVQGDNNQVGGENSFVLGNDNIIGDAAQNTVIFGNNITANTQNQTYVQNLNVTENFVIGTGVTFDGFPYLPLSGDVMTGNFTAETITIKNGEVLNAASGGGQLDLRYGGDDSVMLSNDGGSYSNEFIYMEPGYMEISAVRTGGSRINLFTNEYNSAVQIGDNGGVAVADFVAYGQNGFLIESRTQTSNEKLTIKHNDLITIECLKVLLPSIPTYANNAAAVADGLPINCVYKTGDGALRIVV
jgi:hypothetical protein